MEFLESILQDQRAGKEKTIPAVTRSPTVSPNDFAVLKQDSLALHDKLAEAAALAAYMLGQTSDGSYQKLHYVHSATEAQRADFIRTMVPMKSMLDAAAAFTGRVVEATDASVLHYADSTEKKIAGFGRQHVGELLDGFNQSLRALDIAASFPEELPKPTGGHSFLSATSVDDRQKFKLMQEKSDMIHSVLDRFANFNERHKPNLRTIPLEAAQTISI